MSDTPPFNLRPARLADAECIFALIRQHPDELVPKPMGDIVAIIDRFVVAEVEGEIVGCATYSILPEIGTAERATVELQSVAVSAAHRRLGIGRALVERPLRGQDTYGQGLVFHILTAWPAQAGPRPS